jgi:hypothetical protein
MSQPKPVKTQILYKPNFFKVPLYEMFVNLTYINQTTVYSEQKRLVPLYYNLILMVVMYRSLQLKRWTYFLKVLFKSILEL